MTVQVVPQLGGGTTVQNQAREIKIAAPGGPERAAKSLKQAFYRHIPDIWRNEKKPPDLGRSNGEGS